MSDLAAAVENTLGDWAQAAPCRGADPDIFHPVDGDYRPASSYCDRCPVRANCLAHALARGEPAGMWGGLDPDQRRRLRGTAQMAPPPDERAVEARRLSAHGMAATDIARHMNLHPNTVYGWVRSARKDTA